MGTGELVELVGAAYERVWFVEDMASMWESVGVQMRHLATDFRPMSHRLALETGVTRWGTADLVILDAYDLSRRRDDPSCSLLAALEVLGLLAGVSEDRRPTVVCYSTEMHAAEVHVPLWSTGMATAFFDLESVTDDGLAQIVAGDLSGGLPEPSANDWARLNPHLPVGARVAEAHDLMRSRPDTWRLIYDDRAPFSKAAQMWITRRVLPVLGVDPGVGYRVAVDVVRQVAQLPAR